MRAVLAGGGTGGHVIPALAIAHELKSRFAAEVLFIGTARGIETRLVPAAGYPLNLIEIGALKSVGLATRIRTLFKLPGSILQSRQFLREFQADVVISVGGYASGPTMVGAAMSKIPVLIFEPNLVPGFANRMGARFATAAATQFQATCRYFRNCTVTGIPVRKAFFDVPKRAPHSNPTVLVFGGSQGARAINRAVTGALSLLKEKIPGLTLIHQTGEREFEEIQKAYFQSGFPGTVSSFIDDMPGAFAQSDLLICRSGASTVAEVAAAGKPAIFIPLPTAADDHQTRNAEALVAAGAAALLKQGDLTPDSLVEKIQNLLQNPAGLATMSEAAQKLAYRNAAEEVAKLAVNLSQQRVKK